MKKRYPIIAGLLSVVLLLGAASCGGGGWYDKDIWMTEGSAKPTAAAVLPTQPDFGSAVSVHDPSVFYDDATEQYIAFGTHYAVATSKDLIKWEQYSRDGEDTKLFGTNGAKGVLTKMVQELNTVGDLDLWAPDVMKIGGMYYMYVSGTEAFGKNHSTIVRVRANSALGPYREEEVLVTSTGSGQPNCIDPELFYDKDGNLWMVYGSFFDGIYIKALDSKGLPKEEGFGKLLWKGNGTGAEGPFIFYNAELGYYYLMASDGSLSSDYNMRVARSEKPDGPYVDITGTDVSELAGRGTKLAGNYHFDGDTAYAALGHNSVIKKDGKYLVVHHIRWRDSASKTGVSGPHRLEVRQLFFNKNGWPVLSPNRYAGEAAGTVTEATLAGNYDVIEHTMDTTVTFVDSKAYAFTADGKITQNGTDAGTWTLADGYYVHIKLGNIEYDGVAAPAWRNYGTKAGIYCMTAMSETGASVWLNAAAD